MDDAGRREVDRELERLEKRISDVYKQAAEETQKKLDDYLRQFEKDDAAKRKQIADGTITQEEYKKWRTDEMLVGNRWRAMRDSLAQDFTNADKIATALSSGELPVVYAMGHNFGAYQIENSAEMDLSYTLYDRRTVERLLRDDPDLLPDPRVDIPKDKRWNRQHIQSAVLQGLLQGEPIDKIAKRLRDVSDMDERAAVRNARTSVTGAENAGRVDSFRHAKDLGIELQQEWLSTLDMRTRDSHRHLDGERVDVGKKFSNGCRFPGDPQGAPWETYNCRCTLVAAIKGIDQSNAPRNSKLGNMSYEEWKRGHINKQKTFRDDTYSAERKNNAFWAQSEQEADEKLRKKSGDVWRAATENEKDSLYGYTGSKYTYINQALRKNNFKAVDPDGKYVKYDIERITGVIDKSYYDFDMWLQRGVKPSSAAKFLNIDEDVILSGTEDELKNAILGKTIPERGFCSCGANKGGGFDTERVILNIYAPKGTRMLYCEPFSRHGEGARRDWDGLSKQSDFGETEALLQQNTYFRVIKVEKKDYKVYIDVDVVDQKPKREKS